MKKYIAFLRGITVGHIRIKMPDLRLAFENMGFEAVKTDLQTGKAKYPNRWNLRFHNKNFFLNTFFNFPMVLKM